jgi:hypothetical protein
MHLIVFAIISFKLRSNILMFTCVDVCFKFVCRLLLVCGLGDDC